MSFFLSVVFSMPILKDYVFYMPVISTKCSVRSLSFMYLA